jgi:pimeloyl-[acyl-carrier protein] methyl ester esterase
MSSRRRRIVCIGGWGSTHDAWTDLARELPGYALEPVPWWSCLDPETSALTARLSGLRPALVLGWSLGGLVAMRCACDGLAPDIPVCLLSGTVRMGAEGDYPGADPRALRAMRMRLARDARGVIADFSALCGGPSAPAGFVERYVARSRAVPPGALAAGLAYLAETDVRDRLPLFGTRVHWLHGDRDAVIPHESAVYAASRNPAITLELVPGAGHALPYEAPALVADRIARLLK